MPIKKFVATSLPTTPRAGDYILPGLEGPKVIHSVSNGTITYYDKYPSSRTDDDSVIHTTPVAAYTAVQAPLTLGSTNKELITWVRKGANLKFSVAFVGLNKVAYKGIRSFAIGLSKEAALATYLYVLGRKMGAPSNGALAVKKAKETIAELAGKSEYTPDLLDVALSGYSSNIF